MYYHRKCTWCLKRFYNHKRSFFIHKSWVQQLPATMYSASVVDKETKFYFLAHPRHPFVTKIKTPSKATFSIINTSSPISFWVPSLAIIWALWIPNATIRCSINISNYSFDSCRMGFFGCCLKTCTHSNTRGYIRSTRNEIQEATNNAPIQCRINLHTRRI